MATRWFTIARRFAGFAITLLFSLCLSGRAVGQGAAPLVTATSAVGMSHPSGWGAIQQTAIDANGDWLVVDYGNGAVYEFPAGGGSAITLSAPKGLGGGGQNPGIAIDPGNNLYLEANWNNCIVMFPWDPTTQTWTGLSSMTPDNPSTNICTNSGKGNGPNAWAQYGLAADPAVGFAGWFQPWGIAIGNNNSLIVGTQTNGQFIFSLPVTGWTNPKPATITWQPITGLLKRPISVAQDSAGNVYFVEDSGGLSGVYEVPVGASALTSDCPTGAGVTPIVSTCLTRVDPSLPSVTGVITDSKGNLYISDSTVGVVMVPNPTGVPQTSNAVLLTSVPAQGEVAIDWARNTVYVPTSQKQSNNQADVAKVNFGFAELGASAVGVAGPSGANVVYSFQGSATPYRFVVLEDGATNPDFAITGGTCTTGTAYKANSSCLETITFKPTTVGGISAKLLMQKTDPVPAGSPDLNEAITGWSYDASGKVLTLSTSNNSLVYGQRIVLSAPTTSDPLNVLDSQEFFVLAAGLSKQQFEIQATLSLGANDPTTGKTGATITGYVFTTLSSTMLHGTGVGANVQATPAVETAIGSNLVNPSQIAVDGMGNVYAADAAQGKVQMFAAGSGTSGTPSPVGTGIVAPTGIAVDGAGDIFIADYNNGAGSVYEIPFMSSGVNGDDAQVMLATGLGNNLNLALDNMGTLFVADPTNGRVVKLSNVGGTGAAMQAQSETMLTTGFTAPSAVATDSAGNLYVIDGSNLFELVGGIGQPSTLLNTLSGAMGLAVDPSGAIYITSTAGTTRVPFINGALAPANATMIAADVAGTSSVTIDRLGNVYLSAPTGGSVTEVLTSGTLVLSTPADLTSSTTATATITNSGNAPLIVTSYSNSKQDANPFNPNSVQVTNFTGNEGTCIGDSTSPSTGISAGDTCTVDVIFQPGAGAEGMLTGQVFVASKAVNAPSLAINVAGEGLPLAGSGTVISVATVAEVIHAPATITVASKSSTGAVPSGQVAINFQTWTVGAATSGANKGTPTIFPQVATVIADLDANGKATIQNLASPQTPVLAGSQTFTVEYIGDRVYGRSPGTQNIVVAKSAIEGIALPKVPDASDVNLPFTMADNGQGTTPYDGSVTPWQYQFIMNVKTTYGVPTGQITMMDDSTKCPAGTSPDGLGTAACVLQNYSGVACPQKQGAAIQPVANAGTTIGGALVGGQAKFDTGCLWSVPQGTTYSPVIYTHSIHPEFGGDDNFLPAKGDSTLFQAVRGPLVQITKANDATTLTTAPALTVTAGSSASIDLTITSLLGYGFAGRNGQLNDSNFPISLTCDMPGIPHAACAVTYDNSIVDPNQITAPNSVQIPCPANPTSTQLAAGSVLCSPAHATVTLYTNVSAGTTTSQNAKVAAVTLAGLFGFGMIGLFLRRRTFEKGRVLLMVFLILVGGALAISITACSTTNLSPQSQLTTKAGTYKMTITAQEVGTQCIPQSGAGSNCTINGQPGVLVYGTNNQVSLPFYVNVTVQ